VARIPRGARSLIWLIPSALILATIVVLVAQGIRQLPSVEAFVEQFPGETALPDGAPVGFPAWLGWQHFLNGFFLLLIVRTGWQLRTAGRPTVFWKRNNDGLIRTKNHPTRISLTSWFHLSLDALWVLNGIVFYVLIFATGQWVRIVPVSWDVFPHALSAALQYASLDWPLANGWVNYNALQLLAYFVTVFVAAPLAIVTGIRMSPAWSIRMRRVTPLFPIALAKNLHVATMVYFVAFVVVHVTLVLTTGALRNLNHMYGGSDDESWVGAAIFAASLVVLIIAWVAARPKVLEWIAGLGGTVTRRG
jgi:thiosulfate reductase cytochrome b subunit